MAHITDPSPTLASGWTDDLQSYRRFWLSIFLAAVKGYLSGRNPNFLTSGSFVYLSGLLDLPTEKLREALRERKQRSKRDRPAKQAA